MPNLKGIRFPYIIFDNSGTRTTIGNQIAGTNGLWTAQVPNIANDGTYKLGATYSDSVGNIVTLNASALKTIIIDTTVDNVTAIDLLSADDNKGLYSGTDSDDLTNNDRPRITGTGVDGETVVLMRGNITLNAGIIGSNGAASGTWTISAQGLSRGNNLIEARHIDHQGNVVNKSMNITYDDLVGNNEIGGFFGTNAKIIATDKPVFAGTAAVAGDIAEIVYNGTVVGSAVVDVNQRWKISSKISFSDGEHTLESRIHDSAGNILTSRNAFTFTIDTTIPNVTELRLDSNSDTGQFDNDRITRDNTPTLVGQGVLKATL